MRYDDSLPTLIRAARSNNLELESDAAIVVRDTAGRLAVAFENGRPPPAFTAQLKEALGAYAVQPDPVISPLLFATLKDAKPSFVSIKVDGSFANVTLLDRRVVGMDWLSDFTLPAAGAPRLVFGSLKGGVGRSTALAVLAADLANNGKKVLCVELDLEAPGIGSMLLHETPDDRRPMFGSLDYLVENGLGGTEDEELFDHIGISQFGGGSVHVLPAVGRITD
jgi:Mrp family chromosome partitioning ATPase